MTAPRPETDDPIPHADADRRLAVAIRAAEAAGAYVRERFLTVGVAEASGKDAEEGWNPVSEVDRGAEHIIVDTVRESFPDDRFLGEENVAGQDREADDLWIIDPIDGTSNYLHGIPHYGVAVGYAHRGRVDVAACLDPSRGELFTAVRGRGAHLNGRPIHVSSAATLDAAMICTGFYYDRGAVMERTLAAIRTLFGRSIHGIRRSGSAVLDLCWVAAGRYDAYFEYTLSAWDFAAASLIAAEAGATVTGVDGRPLTLDHTNILGCAPALSTVLLELVGTHDEER